MGRALPGEHYCLLHQGNHSHYAAHNCTVCKLAEQRNELLALLQEMLPRFCDLRELEGFAESELTERASAAIAKATGAAS